MNDLKRKESDLIEKIADCDKRKAELQIFGQDLRKQLAKLRQLIAQQEKINAQAAEISVSELPVDVLKELSGKLK